MLSLLLLLSLMLMQLHDTSKSYIYIKNSDAKDIFKYTQSDDYKFNDYCQKCNIPETGTIYLSGMVTSYSDLIIESNKYCSQNENISVRPANNETINFYWTLKIINNNISEIWTCKVPLKQEQLKSYTFDEQIKMIPIFKRDRSNYAIGYYKNDTTE